MTDTLLVSINHDSPDHAVLIVGKKRKNKPVEIINAFQGKGALDLYQQLITVNKPTE